MKRRPGSFFRVAATLGVLLAPAFASATSVTARPTSITVTSFDISPPLRDLVASTTESSEAPASLGVDFASEGSSPDPVVQSRNPSLAIPSPLQSFNAINGAGFNINPPTPAGDVGPNHFVVMANIRFAVYDKSGTLLLGPINNNTLWAGFGGECQNQNSGNAYVIYDPIADRWILAQPTYSGPAYSMCLAVSTTSDPTGSYYRWSYSFGTRFPDAPRFAIWPDALYLGTREFDTSGFIGAGAYAFHRGDLINGVASPRVIPFLVPPTQPYNVGDGLYPADLDGSRQPPAGSPAYFLGSMDFGGPYGAPQDALTLYRFQANFTAPLLSTFVLAATLPVSTFDSIFPCAGGNRRCIPQPGAMVSQYLDFLSYRQRLMNRIAYRNFGTHESIVACQGVEAGIGPSGPVAGMRWYEVRSPNGTPVVHQQGTFAPGLIDDIHRWAGSIAMDHQGNLALGYSVSSASTTFPGIRYTGRLASDPLNQMLQGESTIVHGGGIQSTTNNRWGDHSMMTVDPTDDCTFWYLNEYYPVTSATGWMLRVGTFKFAECTPSVGVDDGPPPSGTRLASLGAVRGPVEVAFTLGGSEFRGVQLDVIDVTGRRIRHLLDESMPGGRYRVTWDRTTDGGDRVRPGVYLLRLVAGNESDSEAVILLQ